MPLKLYARFALRCIARLRRLIRLAQPIAASLLFIIERSKQIQSLKIMKM
jgi:hypothetical protein